MLCFSHFGIVRFEIWDKVMFVLVIHSFFVMPKLENLKERKHLED
jgi:hypothetical protein